MTTDANPITEHPFNQLVKHFEENESVETSVRETALAINAKLLCLGELAVDAQKTILNKPAAMWLETHEGNADAAQAAEAIQQLETCRIGTCQGIIFDVNSLQISTSQLDRLGGTDGDRRNQSLVEPTMNTIRDDLALLHFTTLARAGMLSAEDNTEACMGALGDYAAFLDGTILQNIALFERLSINGNAWKELGDTIAAFRDSMN